MLKEGQDLYKCCRCKELFVYDKNNKKILYEGKIKPNIDFLRCPYCGTTNVVEHGLDHIAKK